MIGPIVPAPDRLATSAAWLAKLRWVAAVGQLATIFVVAGPLGVAAPRHALLLLVGVTLVTNGVFVWWLGRALPTEAGATHDGSGGRSAGVWHAALGGLMLLDLAVLTAMLGLTGGPTNPFVVFYFVNLALAAVVLPAAWAWLLCGLAVLAFGLLTCQHNPLPILQEPERLRSLAALRQTGYGRGAPIAVWGAWAAFAVCAAVLVNFVTRLTSEVRVSARLRRDAERARARAEKLEALGTLAAGAAHELASPLSTIAVATAETIRSLERAGATPDALEDLRLVRSEVARCRTILDRMASGSGLPTAGAPERITAAELLREVLGELPGAERVAVRWGEGAEGLSILAPRVALAQAVRAVTQNALDAAEERDAAAPVEVAADRLAGTLRLVVTDRGPGFPPEALARAGEPFFTTKSPGRGMGLGLFLARSVVERLGGSLRLESPSGGGAAVTIVLPLATPSSGAGAPGTEDPRL